MVIEGADGPEWPFLRWLRRRGRCLESARQAWEETPKAKGLAAARAGQVGLAIKLLEQARRQAPALDRDLEDHLRELRAIRRLEQRLERRPNDAALLLELGRALFAQERGDDALASFRKAAEVAPRHAEAHALIGLELHFRGDYAAAGEAYRRALQLDPWQPLARQFLADAESASHPGSGTSAGSSMDSQASQAAGG